MAEFPYNELNLASLTITLDVTKLERKLFGWRHWRKHLAIWLLRLSARVMQCGYSVVG